MRDLVWQRGIPGRMPFAWVWAIIVVIGLGRPLNRDICVTLFG